MTAGIALKTLRQSLEIPRSELARELNVTPSTLADAEMTRKMGIKAENRYMAALATLAKRRAADRRRAATESLLTVASD